MKDYPEAAKESSDYVILQQRLRDLQILEATVTGNFRVLVPAIVPEAPISPKPVRNAALGLRGRPAARHRSRLPARAARHARAAAGRRRRRARSAHPGAHPASHARPGQGAPARHAGASGRPGLGGVPAAAQQPLVHGRGPQGQDDHGDEQPAGRGQERARRQPGRHARARRARRSSSSTPTCAGLGSTGCSTWTNTVGASSLMAGESQLADSLQPVGVLPDEKRR